MNLSARKNRVTFFGGAILSMVAIFIFSVICLKPLTANAYAVGSIAGSTPTATGGYNIGDSFQHLISPFTKFMSDLDFSSNTTINVHGEAPGFPTVDLTPIVTNGAHNILSQWGTGIDNWFYGLTGVRLSGIFHPSLVAISWVLGLAKNVVDWLLGLFN